MSHFANADEHDASFDDIQIVKFREWVAMIHKAWYSPAYIHHNNSAWVVRHQDAWFTASRVWLSLLWYSPFERDNPQSEKYSSLKPSLSVRSTVTAIQHLQKWESVSYWHRWTAEKKTTIAVIPFGYNEWLRRSLRWKWHVRRGEQYFPVVGTICMNLCCIDIGGADVRLWDRIEVIANHKDSPNSMSRFAVLDETIVYEVLVNLDSFGRRVLT